MSIQLPEEGFLRERQIIGDPKADPPIPAIIPIGRSTWWKGVKDGVFPAPLKLSPRVTVWTVSSIRKLLEEMTKGLANEAK